MKYLYLLIFSFLACSKTELRTGNYPNGQLMFSKEYEDGEKNGLLNSFHPNENKESEGLIFVTRL